MIIDSVDFYNVGTFRGSQSVQLTPSSPGHIPVVLIGGQNGRGKTTLLDSIHYALYGRNARLAKRGDLSWEEFLKGLIHRHSPKDEGAAITLQLRFHAEGTERHLKIQREWKANSGKVKETLTVWMDGSLAPEVAEEWTEFVENLIPSRIAHLFLFDGEQIAALADPDKSREILRTGIYGLLGADLLDRLDKDLLALGRRYRMDAAPQETAKEVERLQGDCLEAKQAVSDLAAAIKSLQEEVARLHEQREGIQSEIQSQGGHLLERRNGLEQEERHLQTQITEMEDEIRRLQSGILPLVGVRGLLEEIGQQAAKEQILRGGQEWLERLTDRDKNLLKDMEKARVSTVILKRLESWLEKDREILASDLRGTEVEYDFSPEGYAQLQHLLHGGIQETSIQFEVVQVRLSAHRGALEKVQRSLARIPDPEAVRHLLEARAQIEQKIGALAFEIQSKEKGRAEAEGRLTQLERRLAKEHTDLELSRIESALQRRNIEHLERAKDTVRAFRDALVARDIHRIEKEILRSAQTLYSKKKLISRVSIDPGTFQITIFDSTGEAFSVHQLSAGERQILAISILWGLCAASGKSLPVIIDTPLGRLDHNHRENLVVSYFHKASHQVVLLSTEEEITPAFYQRLSPWVGRVCSLIYNEETQSSHFEAGRFFGDFQHLPIHPLVEEVLP
ncbi:hypothetical protein GETHOR_08190 [Geothrix oryzae]|uniref:Rad50/SbcC-type AAA domain-containing protein n=1 Tax=Geothrix oryzae TaxID=2927975 RepID=A0ABM8DPB9_9BACT|nr:DNA sulfur modification protein DndD [Geothrix oryzae]BDU68718.1 hypothetical protein GETHOR_08190 [Geothrix oryzae]